MCQGHIPRFIFQNQRQGIWDNVCKLSKYPPASFGCITRLESASFDEKKEITLVMELSGRGRDTSWILEVDD
eukprot:scaffold116400_cov81-Cyclotella_meneghiniana.AAC.1